MDLQTTVGKAIELIGTEPFAGCSVETIISPAEPDTGILFRNKRGEVESHIDNAVASYPSTLLTNGKISVAHSEHLLSTFFWYGIDNAIVDLRRLDHTGYRMAQKQGIATDISVVPHFEDLELTVCEALDGAGIVMQEEPRRYITIAKNFGHGGLSFSHKSGSGIVIRTRTIYEFEGEPFEQSYGPVLVSPAEYRKIAKARAHAKEIEPGQSEAEFLHHAAGRFSEFGAGTGWNSGNLVFPVNTLDEWLDQERMPAEVAAHAAIDRIGAIALLPGRLTGVFIRSDRSGHHNDIYTLTKNPDKFFGSHMHGAGSAHSMGAQLS